MLVMLVNSHELIFRRAFLLLGMQSTHFEFHPKKQRQGRKSPNTLKPARYKEVTFRTDDQDTRPGYGRYLRNQSLRRHINSKRFASLKHVEKTCLK